MSALPEGWHRPAPDHIPSSSACPAAVAFGSMFLLWGLLASPLLLAVGGMVLLLAVGQWVREIRHDRRT